MAKKKKESNIIKIDEVEIESKIKIDYDELASAIARAKQLEKETEKRERAEALEKWRKEIGYKDYSDKKGFLKKFFRFCNNLKVFWKLMFFSRKKHIETSPTSGFIQGLTSGLFMAITVLLTVLFAMFIFLMFCHPERVFGFRDYFMCGALSIVSIILSRIFRLMSIEIDQMTDREQILGVFTAVMATVPLIEKIVELFKGGG